MAKSALKSPALERITFNLRGGKANIRRETLNGRDYIVAPMVMMTEGVHAGSNGALYYPAKELASAVPAWNHKPIVVYHPVQNGRNVSAADPIVLDQQAIGLVLNTAWDEKQRAEAWIDTEAAKRVDGRVLEALENGKMVEVSTGLFTDNVYEPGEFGGKEYEYVACNHRPDHLAILPDKKGACSIEDGAGLLQVNDDGSPWPLHIREQVKIVANIMMSHGDVHSKLFHEIDRRSGGCCYIRDVFDKWFVYHYNGGLYKQVYAVKDEVVTLTGDPVEVREAYVTVDGALVGNATTPLEKENQRMPKKELVDHLIANGGYEESDRAALEAMDESKLKKIAEAVPAPTDNMDGDKKKKKKDEEDKKTDNQAEDDVAKAAAPAAPQPPVTAEQYVANAPREVRDLLNHGLSAYNQQKERLIGTITANKANIYTKEHLAMKDMQELQAIAALAAPAGEGASQQPAALYIGAAGGPVANVAPVEEGGLSMPKMDFAK